MILTVCLEHSEHKIKAIGWPYCFMIRTILPEGRLANRTHGTDFGSYCLLPSADCDDLTTNTYDPY